jgi:hypothetical protein
MEELRATRCYLLYFKYRKERRESLPGQVVIDAAQYAKKDNHYLKPKTPAHKN